jgi:threonine synthase
MSAKPDSKTAMSLAHPTANADWRHTSTSLAYAQQSMGDGKSQFDLYPVLTAGCPRTSSEAEQFPLELAYRYDQVDPSIFNQPPLPGLDRWAALLPPLMPGLSMGEGGTALIEVPRVAQWAGLKGKLFVKDESGNPTWSHKDRLNLCTVSAAVACGAPGIAVASSGNHGASAAAYAARAGLKCIVVASPAIAPVFQQFIKAYGAALVTVPSDRRWPVLRDLVARTGFHPVSNLTHYHTGHPFGPEGYKTIAYEIFSGLGGEVPGTVIIPTGYGELLYGVWKGFKELHLLGAASRMPRMFSAEPQVRGPLARAIAAGKKMIEVEPRSGLASSVMGTVNSYRGVLTIEQSSGRALTASDEDMIETRRVLAHDGQWQELSGAAGLAAMRAALRDGMEIEGPVVAVLTSSGLKDVQDSAEPPLGEGELNWGNVDRQLAEAGIG